MKTYIIASTVIFNEEGKILILKRSDDDPLRPGEPDLPGGEAEEQETPLVAARREILEETGINYGLQNIRLVFGWSTVKYHTEEKTDVNFVHTSFLAELPANQEIKLSNEHQGFEWQTLDEAIKGFADRPSKKYFLEYLRDNNIEPRLNRNESNSSGGVVIGPSGKILVVSQGTSWSLPKGHIEPGETARNAAEREITEESGIKQLEFIKELGSYDRYRISIDGKGEDTNNLKHITMFLFKTQQTELKPQDPHNPEARWVEPKDVSTVLTHPKDKEFFESIFFEVI